MSDKPNTTLCATECQQGTVLSAYAGIGSRKIPRAVLELMTRFSSRLGADGWVLRSGMAAGADQAFYRGTLPHGAFELYLPWPAFEAGARSSACGPGQLVLGRPSPAAYELAAQFHPAWSRLTRGVRALHARNCHQILGADLASPARFVVCWTPDGSLDGRGRNVGGTGQALRIALHYGTSSTSLDPITSGARGASQRRHSSRRHQAMWRRQLRALSARRLRSPQARRPSSRVW